MHLQTSKGVWTSKGVCALCVTILFVCHMFWQSAEIFFTTKRIHPFAGSDSNLGSPDYNAHNCAVGQSVNSHARMLYADFVPNLRFMLKEIMQTRWA